MTLAEKTIAIIGLGYVGLPLAVEFGKNVMSLVLTLIRAGFRSYAGVLIRLLNVARMSCN